MNKHNAEMKMCIKMYCVSIQEELLPVKRRSIRVISSISGLKLVNCVEVCSDAGSVHGSAGLVFPFQNSTLLNPPISINNQWEDVKKLLNNARN